MLRPCAGREPLTSQVDFRRGRHTRCTPGFPQLLSHQSRRERIVNRMFFSNYYIDKASAKQCC